MEDPPTRRERFQGFLSKLIVAIRRTWNRTLAQPEYYAGLKPGELAAACSLGCTGCVERLCRGADYDESQGVLLPEIDSSHCVLFVPRVHRLLSRF
jgi:hypothetical protein